MKAELRVLDTSEVALVSGGYKDKPDIVVFGPGGGFNPGETYSPGFTGNDGGGGGGGMALVGAYSINVIWDVVKWAVDHAWDAISSQHEQDAQAKAAAEKAISSQFDPKKVVTYGADNYGNQFRIVENGDIFIDTDKNGSYDTISRRGGDGHIYNDIGDGRGFVDQSQYWTAPK